MKSLRKKFLSAALALALLTSAMAPAMAAEATFSDVTDKHWAKANIERAAAEGWVNGVGDGKFNPEGTLSRIQFVAILSRAFYKDQIPAQTDGQAWWEPYAAPYIEPIIKGASFASAWSSERGMTEAVASENITRSDMAQMMYNILKDKGAAPTQDQINTGLMLLPTGEIIGQNYMDAVGASYALGLITGKDGGVFAGNDAMTRAEAATVLGRLYDKI